MSSDAESISSGMTLPGWMRSRIEKNDFDGIPFSPPSHDESFFYVRYPVTTSSTTSTSTASSSGTKLSDNDIKSNNGIRQITGLFNESNKFRHVDFSNHTEPCKKFLKDSSNTPGGQIKNPPKSFGTDDGFKGPGAACGSSIVKVAQQMVSGRSLSSRGFQIVNLEQQEHQHQITRNSSDPDNGFQTKTVEDQQVQSSKLIQPQTTKFINDIIVGVSDLNRHNQQQDYNQQQQQQEELQQQMTQSSRLMYRRGSKSLPSSPLGSPKSMRKYNPNPYFTTTSLFSSNNSSSDGRSWFLSSLLGIQREATSTSSITHIEEEEPDNISTTSTQNKNNKISGNQKILKAKPSELREMNFWSPTSM